MFQPKQFYRELEELLHRGSASVLTDEWYTTLADQLMARFGGTLSLGNWRLYEEFEDGFRLEERGRGTGVASVESTESAASRNRGAPSGGVATATQSTAPPAHEMLAADSLRLAAILDNGVYIFHAGQWNSEAPDTGAMLLLSEPRRILSFELARGWQRDDLDFTLNTVRNAVNLRIRLESLNFDLQQAAEIQRSLLPESIPRFAGYSIAARSISAEQVGGDFFDFLPDPDPGSLRFAIGDASGHGLSAALMARDIVTGLRMGAEGSLKITEIVRRLNRVLSRSRLSSRFVSLFLAELGEHGDLFYVNAGHPHAWILGGGPPRRLDVGGTVLGPLDDATFRGGWARLEPGEALVVVTDGILEQPDHVGRLFGEEAVERCLTSLPGQSAPEMLDELYRAAREHGGSRPWTDDTSAVLIVRDAIT